MELLNKGETVVFSDGVSLVRSSDTLTADKMVTDKERDKIHAYGDVCLHRKMNDGESWKGYGAEGFYDTKPGTGFLLGKGKQAHLIYNQVLSSTETRKIDLFADRVDFSNPSQIGYAKGNVYGRTVDPGTSDLYEFWSQNAELDKQKNVIILSGRVQPLVTQTKGDEKKNIRGDVITYYIDSKKFVAEGKSQAVFFNPPKRRN